MGRVLVYQPGDVFLYDASRARPLALRHAQRRQRRLLLARACGRSSTCGRNTAPGSAPRLGALAVQRRHPHHRLAREPRGRRRSTSSPTRTCTPRACGLLRPYRVRDHRHPSRIPLDRDVGRDGGLSRPRRPADVPGRQRLLLAHRLPRDLPGVIEVRRGEDGIRAWEAEPGEYCHSFTGEFGGLWRRQGRPPQAARSASASSPRASTSAPITAASPEPRPARRLHLRGRRTGRADRRLRPDRRRRRRPRARPRRPALGTPPHALVLASSEAHSDLFMLRHEEFGVVTARPQGHRSTPTCAPTWSSSRRRTAAPCSRPARSPGAAASAERLRQQRLADHRQRAAPLPRSGAPGSGEMMEGRVAGLASEPQSGHSLWVILLRTAGLLPPRGL